ncbi:AAA family ATPase [Microbacterium oleivorans]|uniref:AAA family ATPase n=1 Tax=Microbacterium oleivorans TaxID=273677 RepID=UPI00204200F1|nr:AAA family ATPase [Microbacterium oleivorans]MCM3695949.1 AAA family ATPase [Microbacterium oleivorans]
MPYIERLQVDAEGFLAGIDIHFTPGLNVIVGARGTGKTSIIELVRYALGASAFTKSAADRGKQQAQAILGGGAVTVTVRDGDSVFQAHRSGSMDSPSFAMVGVSCTVLGQNEIEAVGAQKSGRLHLIDRFRDGRQSSTSLVESLTASVASSTQAIVDLLREIESLKDTTASAVPLRSELESAREQQLELLANSQASDADQQELTRLQASAQVIGVRSELIAQQEREAAGTKSQIQRALSDLSEDASWPDGAGKDVFESVRAHRRRVAEALTSASTAAQAWEHAIRDQKVTNDRLRVRVDQKSRELRQSLELLQAGASQAARTVADLEERLGQLAATNSRLAKRQEHLATIVAQRDEALNQLENAKQAIFDERQAIVARLNEQVGPIVRVEISKSAGTEEYSAAIIGALRGSGLHYNALAPLIADAVAPHELVRWVENQDAAALARVVNLATERAAVVLSALRASTPDLISVNVPDEVDLLLLDGKDYKSTDRLSLGQRCTVVLPLLLGHTGDPLLLDQPEDHLDNAFIAETLVAALLRRQPEVQYIFASHNANIPVIGNADNVIVMASDGENGFVAEAGGLDDQTIVEAIERIMEGGVEAFEKRAAFYGSQEAE